LEIEVLPDFEIDEKKIKKIKIKKTKVSIEDNEVDEQIKQIEKKFTTYISKEDFNIVELNDKVTIDTL
jgi:FKBP-type peptidyl-prolyl cis-trans isomerase (trigger factor)